MYFPRLYPDELLYSAVARCRVHLGVDSHKSLLRELFGDTKVAAITDLPSHLESLASNTGLDNVDLAVNHTLFPLYSPFIPQERRQRLLQAMLAPNMPVVIGLAGASTALVKWPEWLRYCPLCIEGMVAKFGEPYWLRSWQVQGVDVCSAHGCALVDSPIPFRRAQRHEFHAASSLFLHPSSTVQPCGKNAVRLADALTQLLAFRGASPSGYEVWTNFYRYLAAECGAMKGQQIKTWIIWERLLELYPRDWLAANGLWATEPPSWLQSMFRKHRKAFGCLQHLIVWTSLRSRQSVDEIMADVMVCSAEIAPHPSMPQLPADAGVRKKYRSQWLAALNTYGGAKAARSAGFQAVYAWIYRHDRVWLLNVDKTKHARQGNNSCINWAARDRKLVRLLVRIGEHAEADLSLPRKSRSWFLRQLPHRASVERHLDELSLCRAYLDRYAESVGEYQIRRLTNAMIEDAVANKHSRGWQLARRCGLQKGKITPLAASFIASIGGLD
jgi:hypothetical protein